MDSLKHLIKELYSEIADNEVILAENHLLGFFRKLEAIESTLFQEDAANSNELSNKDHNENHRS